MVGVEGQATAVRQEPVTPRPTPAAVRKALRAAATRERARAAAWYFKTGPGGYGEGDRFLGVTVPDQRRIARTFRDLPDAAVVRLLHSPWHEERLVAVFVLVGRYERGTPEIREAVFRLYMDHLEWVNNWDLVDSSAPQIVGGRLAGTRRRGLLRRLAKSPSVWERRVAILATLRFIRDGDYADTLALATLLLRDPHDLIHKAVGWMLREVANRDRATAEAFLDRHAANMPRTMLRYAIEKLPAARRTHYLRLRPSR